MFVEMELSRVVIDENGGEQLVYLRERGGPRQFPILIGIHEALAIYRRLHGEKTARPMTHDLLASVIAALGATLERILIHDLVLLDPKDTRATFIATLFLRRGGDLVQVDSRPSDAIALGAAMGTPIFVADKVLDNATDTVEDRIAMLKEYRTVLAAKIAAIDEQLADQQFVAKTEPAIIEKARRQLQQMKAECQAIDQVLEKHA